MSLTSAGLPSNPAAVARSSRRGGSGVLVGVLAFAAFMSSLDLFIVNLAFPDIGRDFGSANLGGLSWVLNAYTIVFAATLIPAGRIADRVGRRRIFIAGMVVFSLGSLLCGLAPGVGWLVTARVVQAVGAGMMVPASMSLLLAAIPPARRVAALGAWSALGALGAALGPVIGGLLVEAGWRWVFWVNVPVGVAAVVLASMVLTESRDHSAQRRPDLLGAAVLAGSVGLLAWALVEAPAWGWHSARVLGVLAASAVGAAVLLARSARHPAPVLDLSLFGSRSFSGAVAASVLYYAGFGAFVLNAVEYLTGVWGYSPIRAGLAIAPGPLMVLPFARVVAPRLIARLGSAGRVAALGCAVNAAAQALWLVSLSRSPAYLTHLLPAQLLGGVGVGLAIPALLTAGSASLPPERFGTGSGVLNTTRQIGTVIGVAALVAVLGAHATGELAGFRQGISVLIGFFAAAAVVSITVLGRHAGAAGRLTGISPAARST